MEKLTAFHPLWRAGISRGAWRDSARRCSAALALAALLLFGRVTCAQEARATESQVKSAYLYNFGKFVTWPSQFLTPSDDLKICILGEDPFGATLDSTIAGEKINGHRVIVKRVSAPNEEDRCNILFIAASREKGLRSILASAQRSGMLTVSDIPHFAERGGIIGFVTQQDRIRFEVNRYAAEQSRLQLSSELLKVASRVVEKAVRRGGL